MLKEVLRSLLSLGSEEGEVMQDNLQQINVAEQSVEK
jgi:hypothetical protein